MNFLNICIVEGNLTKDAEVRAVNQDNVTSFSIAYNESFTSKEKGLVSTVSFFNVEVWGQNFATKIAPLLKKGTSVRVTGKLRQDTWVAQDGTKREKIFIRASSIDFVSYQRNNNGEDTPRKENEVVDDIEVYDELDSVLDKVSSAVTSAAPSNTPSGATTKKESSSRKKKVG